MLPAQQVQLGRLGSPALRALLALREVPLVPRAQLALLVRPGLQDPLAQTVRPGPKDPLVPPARWGQQALRARLAFRAVQGLTAALGIPDRQALPDRKDPPAQEEVPRAIRALRAHLEPGPLDRPELLAQLDLLGRLVRLERKELQDQQGPLEKPVLQEAKDLRDLRAKLDLRGLPGRLEILATSVVLEPRDPLVPLALALLVQRDLLDLPLPDPKDPRDLLEPPVKE